MDPILIVVIVLAVAIVGGLIVVRRRATPPTLERSAVSAPPRVEEAAPPGLRSRLGKTRRAISDRLGAVLRADHLDGEFWSDVEDTLVAADVGVGVPRNTCTHTRKSFHKSKKCADSYYRAASGETVFKSQRSILC